MPRRPSEALIDLIAPPTERDRLRALTREEFQRVSISLRVRDLRKRAGLSQAELAARAGTRQPHISRLENGEEEGLPSLDLLARVAQALCVTLEVRLTPDVE